MGKLMTCEESAKELDRIEKVIKGLKTQQNNLQDAFKRLYAYRTKCDQELNEMSQQLHKIELELRAQVDLVAGITDESIEFFKK